MNNSLTSAHMKTSQLKSYFRSGSDSNGLAFFNKWYYFVNFIRKTKRQRLVTNDKEIADDIKKCFSNAVKNERIRKFSDTEPLADNISHSTLKS